uniref:Uncharacterized protein n=1 Tax=Opuntia streptacantha TaxID=393608 RepID=A0A7C9EF88_OPUST
MVEPSVVSQYSCIIGSTTCFQSKSVRGLQVSHSASLFSLTKYPCSAAIPRFSQEENHSLSWVLVFPLTRKTTFLGSLQRPFKTLTASVLGSGHTELLISIVPS